MTSLTHEHEQEGVIKFHLNFVVKPVEQPELAEKLALLNAARTRLKEHALLGQDPARYGGDGFGNISVRLDGKRFLISGSQTGHLQTLTDADVALVERCDYHANHLWAHGLCKPSSESMTHGVAYQTLDTVAAVIHVHSPVIWRHAAVLGLPATAADIPYGTPDMAEAVRQLLQRASSVKKLSPLIFVMQGHEDGVVSVGDDLAECTQSLLDLLARAKAL
jgi:ribulose-5-phosphate 4-epimerase/fuculose-1-phosphate aldolase